jgi:hypothetical protein
MTILVWLDRARGGSVHEVVGPSIRADIDLKSKSMSRVKVPVKPDQYQRAYSSKRRSNSFART